MQASPHSPEELAHLAELFNQRTAEPKAAEPSRFSVVETPKPIERIRVCGACGLAGKFVKVDGETHHECAIVAPTRQGTRERARRARRLVAA
jgi:hypothetical protein